MTRWRLASALAVAAVGGGLASGSVGDGGLRGEPDAMDGMVPPTAPLQVQVPEGPAYNGQFTYVRIRYGESGTDLRNMTFRRRGRGRGGGAPWSHDWPDAEINFAKILEATTFIDTYMREASGRILTLDDPELFKYPVATIIEVGYWQPSDSEIANLRAYLLKGGMLIVDDTRDERGYELRNLATHLRRALPEYQILPVPDDHEIFDTFFNIENPHDLLPPYGYYPAEYMGIFEDNDPYGGRVMVMINWNQDLQEYWEYSDRGYYPIDLSNEAYKFGVNYMVYAFTH